MDSNLNLTANDSQRSIREMAVPEPPMYVIVLASFLYCPIFLVGVVGNILVIVVVAAVKRIR